MWCFYVPIQQKRCRDFEIYYSNVKHKSSGVFAWAFMLQPLPLIFFGYDLMDSGIHQVLLLIWGAAQSLDILHDMFSMYCCNAAGKFSACRISLRIDHGDFQCCSLLSKRYVLSGFVYDNNITGTVYSSFLQLLVCMSWSTSASGGFRLPDSVWTFVASVIGSVMGNDATRSTAPSLANWPPNSQTDL